MVAMTAIAKNELKRGDVILQVKDLVKYFLFAPASFSLCAARNS